MRRDLIIGILCSVLLHGGLAWSGTIDLNFSKKKKVVKAEEPTIELIEMPKIEPEPPEPVESEETSFEPATIAPPSIADVPGVVTVDSFVQAVQPPPPPKVGGMTQIPKTQGPAVTRGMSEVFDLKNLDQQPVLRNRVVPVYPFEMKRQGIGAKVVVEFICDNTGTVREARVVNSDNHAFDSAAIDAVLKWKFRPGRKGGRAVAVRMVQPLEFSINDE